MHRKAFKVNSNRSSSNACFEMIRSVGLAPGNAYRLIVISAALALALAFASSALRAQVSQAASESGATLDPVVVRGNYDTRIGTTDAASAGTVNSTMIQNNPLLRPAEVLEFVHGRFCRAATR